MCCRRIPAIINHDDMAEARLAVIVPVYNRAKIVVRTLESIALQSYRPFHLVLVDNNSTDGTLAVLEEFKRKHEAPDMPVSVVVERRQGAAAARNAGLRASESEWVMFFDSDDVMDYRLIDRYMSEIAASHGDVDIVITKVEINYPDGSKRQYPYYKRNLFVNHILHGILSTQRFMARRSLIEKVGGWNDTLPNSCWDDWELGSRILLSHPRVAFMGSQVLVRVFFTSDSITGTDFTSKHGCWERAIDTVGEHLARSEEPDKERLLKLLEYRRVALAANYRREGSKSLAAGLWSAAYSRVRHDLVLRWLYALAYMYVSAGGVGFSHIVKRLVR